MTTIVRAATGRDLESLEKIENLADSLLIDALRPRVWHPPPASEVRVSMGGFVLVAALGEVADPVGFVHVTTSGGHAHLQQLSVLPTHGRRGIGRLLVESALAESARQGYGSVTLRTFAAIPWNAPFYATCGFSETEPTTSFHRALARDEAEVELSQYGRRIQMTAPLERPTDP